jgi:hypothetical protein
MNFNSCLIASLICILSFTGCELLEAKNTLTNKKIVNPSDISGKWLQLNTKTTNDRIGYIFHENGTIEDINNAEFSTKQWELSGDTLKLGISIKSEPENEYTLIYKAYLENQQLILGSFDGDSKYQESYIKTE